MAFSQRHGSPYDRGSADAHYRRPFRPHYYTGATYATQRIDITDENSRDFKAYAAGYFGYIVDNALNPLEN